MALFKSIFTPYLQGKSVVMNNRVNKADSQHLENSEPHLDGQIHFANVDQLCHWFANQGIDTSNWGQGNTKTAQDFWHELVVGDSSLQLDPPLRRVHVAQILIRKNGRVLIESVQEFGNGRRRFRNQVPSEKMKPGEPFLEAAMRCLKEELGVSPDRIKFNESTYNELEVDTDSISYPGLPTQYIFHRMEASVSSLPDDDFWHENTSYSQGDPIKRHFWVWRDFSGTPPSGFN
jgi:8-oxo-dGTP pyrophosphatase MutT (NUDIX family)